MFKKEQDEAREVKPSAPMPQSQTRAAAASRSGPATVGPSITVKGEVSGSEDLIVQGRVEGTVNLAQHNVTIGPSGKVTADIHGRTVIVEGEVTGDLEALEQIVLRHSAVVEGNLKAPRVALEDGAVFRGGIEMDAAATPGRTRGGTATPANERPPVSGERAAAADAARPAASTKGLSA